MKLLLVLAPLAAAAAPNVVLYPAYNQAENVLVPGGTSKGGTVKYLGTFATVAECQTACIASTTRCWSFAHVGKAADTLPGGQCFAVFSPGFNPSYNPAVTSGVVQWPCRSDDDCSLNGKCGQQGACKCRPAWKGLRCETLNLLPPTRGAGYRATDGGHNTSSWGGAVLKGTDSKYQYVGTMLLLPLLLPLLLLPPLLTGCPLFCSMWAAEMTEHCGIGTWQQNSRVIHATSDSPGGVYKRVGVTWEVFSHEPEVVPGPNGEFIMFFTASDSRHAHGSCNCCRPGHGPCDGSTGTGDCGRAGFGDSEAGGSNSYLSWTKDPNSVGNASWSAPQKMFPGYRGGGK